MAKNMGLEKSTSYNPNIDIKDNLLRTNSRDMENNSILSKVKSMWVISRMERDMAKDT
jgi:hypothetical protein